jgi:hypothetical protein
MRAPVFALVISLASAGCYESHLVSDAAMFDGGPRPPRGAYAIPFAPEPNSGTPTMLGDDQLTTAVPIGFSFRFFGATHTTLEISSNGFVTFAPDATDSACCSGLTIPSHDRADGIIAYAWTDLFPPGGGSITHETRGTAPNRRFVLSATSQSWCCDMGNPRVTTQLILHEGTDFIEIHTARQDGGHVYTQGVEDDRGTMALFRPGRVATDFALTNDAVLFVTY